jgi:hypothetical protein
MLHVHGVCSLIISSNFVSFLCSAEANKKRPHKSKVRPYLIRLALTFSRAFRMTWLMTSEKMSPMAMEPEIMKAFAARLMAAL